MSIDHRQVQGKDFSSDDLEALRSDLTRAGLDSWQAGELIASFLALRGYGVSPGDARQLAPQVEGIFCSIECLRTELQKLAFVM